MSKMHKRYKITFRVKSDALPDGEQIYLVGSHELLGAWQPGKVPLVPDSNGDGYWSRTFVFRNRADIEYKFTRGNWDTEAVNAKGKLMSNFHHHVDGNAVLTVDIPNWQDVLITKAEKTVATRITGTVRYHHNLKAVGLKKRDLIVWLPPSYDSKPEKRYPVIYMHDGQNVFDPMTAYTGVDWQADETATRLIKENRIAEPIIVGIYNTVDRLEEYSAGKKGEKYVRFVTGTVKPFIDTHYRTRPEREQTATIGSSMGGLVSFLLAWRHPETFGIASCLSPSFIFRKNQAIEKIKMEKPPKLPLRIYMDCGGIGGERLLHKGCKRMLRLLHNKGFLVGDGL